MNTRALFRAELALTCGSVATLIIMSAGCSSGSPGSADLRDDEKISTATDDRRGDPAPISDATATLWVRGMSCPLCATNVERELKDVPGVVGVAVDMSDGKVSVGLGPPEAGRPSRRDLARAVSRSGFTLARID